VLQFYQELKAAGQWSKALDARERLRRGALLGDAPRSLIKKWLWKRKIRKFL
jgi:hypothetical protein